MRVCRCLSRSNATIKPTLAGTVQVCVPGRWSVRWKRVRTAEHFVLFPPILRMHTSRLFALAPAIACLAGALAAGSCGRSEAPQVEAAPIGSTIGITEIAPSTGEPLKVGQSVHLKVYVAYALTADSGTLGLVVQDANNTPIAQSFDVVIKGSASQVLEANFTVPDTKVVQVFVPLSAQGQAATSTVASRAFKVVLE